MTRKEYLERIAEAEVRIETVLRCGPMPTKAARIGFERLGDPEFFGSATLRLLESGRVDLSNDGVLSLRGEGEGNG